MMSRAKLRDKDGNWNVPYANWNGSKWNRNANWLTNDWNSNYRVVLLDTRVGYPPDGLIETHVRRSSSRYSTSNRRAYDQSLLSLLRGK